MVAGRPVAGIRRAGQGWSAPRIRDRSGRRSHFREVSSEGRVLMIGSPAGPVMASGSISDRTVPARNKVWRVPAPRVPADHDRRRSHARSNPGMDERCITHDLDRRRQDFVSNAGDWRRRASARCLSGVLELRRWRAWLGPHVRPQRIGTKGVRTHLKCDCWTTPAGSRVLHTVRLAGTCRRA